MFMMTYNYKDGTETILLDAVHQAFGSDLAGDAPRTRKNPNHLVRIFCVPQSSLSSGLQPCAA